MKPPILVTGGAGYIGSHAAKALSQAGYLPITYDNLSTGHAWAVQWGPLEKGDLRDQDRLTTVFRTWQPIAVMHFAALAEVAHSMKDPLLYYDHNLLSSLTLFRVMRTFHVNTLVFSSSCSTYGLPVHIPIDETHPQLPINPYGHSKQMIETILNDLHTLHHWKIAILRYFNAAGADANGTIGEAHEPESHLLPRIIQSVLGQISDLEIFGDDYPTRDGTAIRDYIHVEDLALAHVQALTLLLSQSSLQLTLNLGTGQGSSIHEVIRTVEEIARQKVSYRMQPRRPGDPPMLVANANQAKTLLGWQPTHSLHSIVRSAYAWHQSSLNKSSSKDQSV